MQLRLTLQTQDLSGAKRIPSIKFRIELNQISKNIRDKSLQTLIDFYEDSSGFAYLDLCHDLDHPDNLFKTPI